MKFLNWLFSTQPEPKLIVKDNPINNLSENEKELLFEQKILKIIDDMEKDIPHLFDKTRTKDYNVNDFIDKRLWNPYWFTYNNRYDIARLNVTPLSLIKEIKFAIRLGKSDKYLYNEIEDLGYVKVNQKIHNKLESFFTKLCKYHKTLEKERMLLKEQKEAQKRQSVINDFIN